MTGGADVVTIDYEDGIAWVSLNRPEKRNAMNPAINKRMHTVLDEIEEDERCKVMVLTGAGDSFAAGMDLQEYFRDTAAKGYLAIRRSQRDSYGWFNRLRWLEKPSIAMVNGWCFGGAFGPLYSCDLAIAAEEATFGISEVNWGIIPGGNVTKIAADLMRNRDGMYYILTGEPFDGKKAAELGLVNKAVPLSELRGEVERLAKVLMAKNPMVLKAAKDAYRRVMEMPYEAAGEYLVAKQEQLNFLDKTHGRLQGMKQFLDEKSFRPGLGTYDVNADEDKK